MAKLPKRLIKKYGISKKAWSVFRNEKKGKTTKKRGKAKAKNPGSKRRMKTQRRMISNAYIRGAAIDLLGDIASPRINIDSRLVKAGLAYTQKDKVLVGQQITNYAKGGIGGIGSALTSGARFL